MMVFPHKVSIVPTAKKYQGLERVSKPDEKYNIEERKEKEVDEFLSLRLIYGLHKQPKPCRQYFSNCLHNPTASPL